MNRTISGITLAAITVVLGGTALALKFWVDSNMNESLSAYYSEEDFQAVRKIDAHVHIGTSNKSFLEQAVKDNFIVLSINTEVPDYPPLKQQEAFCLSLKKDFPKNIFYLSTFETNSINDPGWAGRTWSDLEKTFSNGAVGIKVWKNIGMVIKNKENKFIMIDDPVFDPIFARLEDKRIPVLGHIGEPKNCWLPLNQMTVNNDKAYFAKYPEYHMYLHPENPSYEKLIQSRDNLLGKFPNLRFIGAHLGSMEWSVDLMAEHLDKYPNLALDLTDRICHLQVQSLSDWQKVHDFFVTYQNRILYGTDLEPVDSIAAQIPETAHETWLRDWKYFVTDDVMTAPQVTGSFKGLKLEKEIVDKIYFNNALNWYPKIEEGI